MNGRKVTMKEVFARAAAEIKAGVEAKAAYEATPEGLAEKLERDAHHARMFAADERFALENPPNPYEDGRNAALSGEPREPPADLSDADADLWLDGFDSEHGPDE